MSQHVASHNHSVAQLDLSPPQWYTKCRRLAGPGMRLGSPKLVDFPNPFGDARWTESLETGVQMRQEIMVETDMSGFPQIFALSREFPSRMPPVCFFCRPGTDVAPPLCALSICQSFWPQVLQKSEKGTMGRSDRLDDFLAPYFWRLKRSVSRISSDTWRVSFEKRPQNDHRFGLESISFNMPIEFNGTAIIDGGLGFFTRWIGVMLGFIVDPNLRELEPTKNRKRKLSPTKKQGS